MKFFLTDYFKSNYRSSVILLMLVILFQIMVRQNYLLFHTIVELLSIVIAFAVFIITWNSRKMLDNNYLYFVGIAYIFIGTLDLFHTITYKGMSILPGTVYHANQFWIATRFIEACTLIGGFMFSRKKRLLNADLILLGFGTITFLIVMSILVWDIFPVCYIDGVGQTPFKIYAEYVVIILLFIAAMLLYRERSRFDVPVYRWLILSAAIAIVSEFCFTLYISIYGSANEIGHYAKLLSYFMMYKAIVETGFRKPTGLIFKNLKDNEEKYRTLSENLPELIMRFNQNFLCLYANSEIEKFLPHPSEYYTGRHVADFGFPLQFENHLSKTLQLAEKTDVLQEVNFDLLDEHQYYSFSVQAIPEHSSHSNERTFLVICYDITDLKLTEKRLQDLNATKDKFFSIIAHDLKNPFTSLIAFSELIHKNVHQLGTDKIANLAIRMNESSKQAYVLLENLLNWSRVQTGALVPHPEVLESRSLIERNIAQSASQALSKGIIISTAAIPDVSIFADRHMVDTVLRNLIANAIKFSYTGSTIFVGAEDLGSEVRFFVADTGLGIERENLERLLQSGSKLSTQGTQEEKGTGLGLLLCKEFIEMSKGTLTAESEFGVGTTIYFTLPVQRTIV